MTIESSRPSGFCPTIFKKLSPVIVPYLRVMYNSWIQQKEIPAVNNLQYVTPQLKPTKNPAKPDSYSPISLTEVGFRILERVLKKKIMQHLLDNNLISPEQHGFYPGKSTVSNILEYQECLIKEMEDGAKGVHGILLDMKRAFDACPHIELIRRLKKAGIRDKVLNFL